MGNFKPPKMGKSKPPLRMLGFQSFQTANKTLKGIEAINMIKKGQVNNLNYSVFNEVKYINQLFGLIL
jgi:transposase, IS6 family